MARSYFFFSSSSRPRSSLSSTAFSSEVFVLEQDKTSSSARPTATAGKQRPGRAFRIFHLPFGRSVPTGSTKAFPYLSTPVAGPDQYQAEGRIFYLPG